MIQILLPALVGTTILTAAVGFWRLSRGENRVSARLRKIRGTLLEEDDAAVSETLFGGSLPLWTVPFRLLSFLLPGHAGSEVLRWELASAGYRHLESRRVFAGLRVVLTVALGFLTMWIATRFQLLQNEILLLTLVGAAIGFMAPWAMLRVKQARRREEITLALPDALDLMVICVEAGQGLNAALSSVTRESSLHSPAMAEELKLVNLEMSTGLPRSRALRNLALRTGIDDIRGLVAVLVQSDKFGTSIGQALRIHAQSLRTRRRQRAEEAARKTPVKMVFPLVFCIFPALLVVILAPGIIELIKALSGVNS